LFLFLFLFTAALLLLYACCFLSFLAMARIISCIIFSRIIMRAMANIMRFVAMRALLRYCCCVTAALLLLHCCFTAALLLLYCCVATHQ
jgi:hypothetical protein